MHFFLFLFFFTNTNTRTLLNKTSKINTKRLSVARLYWKEEEEEEGEMSLANVHTASDIKKQSPIEPSCW